MKQENKDCSGVRGEARASDKELFACKGKGCSNQGRVEEMFNASCDPRGITRAKLLEKVRCKACAEVIAKSNGKKLREPGCGVYPLCRTLVKVDEIEGLDAKRADVIRWVEEKKAAQAAISQEAEKTRRRDENRLVRQELVRDYARHYAEAPVAGPSNVRLPSPRYLQDEQETVTCGLPIACCRHDRPASRFITVMGEVVGVCGCAAGTFTEVFKDNEGDQRYRKLLSTGDPEKASQFAAKWLGMKAGDDE